MPKIGKESSAPADKGTDRAGRGDGWFRSHWHPIALLVILVVAFLLRFVFAYGVSADGDFALSGGSGAEYHLHVVESILNGTYSLSDPTVNYPIGGVLYVPPLFDYLAAGVAAVLGGAESASLAIAVLAPIIGALTCIPVYLVGKEMFDKTIGVVAALVFAFLALPIATTVFSNGNEYGLAAFFVALMSWFAVRTFKSVDAEAGNGKVLVNALVTGILFALAALTWNGFRNLVVMLALVMVIQVVYSRIRGKDFRTPLMAYAVIILVGTLIPAVYYIPAGLMDQVYSGSLIVALVSVVFCLAFLALRSISWTRTVPLLVIVFAVFCVALYLVSADLFSDFFSGNSLYSGNEVMDSVASDRVSMSSAAAYYGWLTLWMPICLVFYLVYAYYRGEKTSTGLFVIVWMFMLFISIWSSYATSAVLGGIVTAVGAAAAMTMVIRRANLREWAHNIRVAGFPGCFRKLVKPLPFASVIVVALLVVLPNVSFAVDAGQPTNTENAGAYYYGNTSFTIKTGDSYPLEDIWEVYEDMPKEGAIVTWIDYSYDAVTQGGFTSVTDTLGGGSVAAASMYVSEGSSGAIASMMLRLMMESSADFSGAFSDKEVYATVRSYIDDPSLAHAEIESNPEVYGSVRSDITDENAVYLAATQCITESMNLDEIVAAYDAVCDISGNSINYLLVDGSMIPLYYGDGDLFSTLAYFAGYSLDGYGAATQFYSINSYYGYTTYTSAMYETFLWRALIGLSGPDQGYSSSYSYISALALSDGTVVAAPGSGLAGFEVAQWLVYYNPGDDATGSDDGWEYIDGWTAIERQKTEGGVINYLASIVLLEYVGIGSGASVSAGTVTAGGEGVPGIEVEVYQHSDLYDRDILYSTAKTKEDGSFSVVVPEGSYFVRIKSGDLVLSTFQSVPSEYEIDLASVSGLVMVDDAVYMETLLLEVTSDATSEVTNVDVEQGVFTIPDLLPGSYTYVLSAEDGTTMGSGSVSVYPEDEFGLVITPTTYTITVTVNDFGGNAIDGTAYETTPIVVATNVSDGTQFTAEVDEDGKAVILVLPGTYTLSMGEGFTSITSTTQAATSSSRTATITAYESRTVTVSSGAPSGTVFTISQGTFSTVSYVSNGQVKFDIPEGVATDGVRYSVYGVSGSTIYYGLYDGGGSVSLSRASYSTVTGVLRDSDGEEIEGTVTFIDEATGFQVSYVTDDEGGYTALVPDATYTVYATDSNKYVYLETGYAVSAAAEKDIDMVDGRKVTSYLRYDTSTSSGNENLPFVLAMIVFTYEGQEFTLYTMTNTSGIAYFYIPDNTVAEVYYNNAEGTLHNDYFSCDGLERDVGSGTSSTSNTVTIRWYGYESEQENYVKTVSYTAELDMTMTFYDDDSLVYELKAGETVELNPGQYEVRVDGSTGHYFSGTVYLYPATHELVGFDYLDVAHVTIVYGDSDSISIETDDGAYRLYEGEYYFDVGYEYYIVSRDTSGSTPKINYYHLDLTNRSAGYSTTVDVSTEADEMIVTGSVGIVADGTVTVEGQNGFQYVFDVSSGAFTLVLPSDIGSVDATAEVTTTVSGVEYTFTATVTLSDMSDGSIRNISVLTTGEDPGENTADFDVEVTRADFSGGTATVTFKVTNGTDRKTSYFVTSGSGWVLDGASLITVDANGSATGTVTGTYDASSVAPGSAGVTLSVTDINGTATVTKDITENSASKTGSEGMRILVAGDEGDEAVNDSISPSQYRYAITFVNEDVYSKTVKINFTAPSGWYATVMDADGTYVAAPGGNLTVYGLQTVTYYVSLMQVSSDQIAEETATVPSITVTISGDLDTQTLTLEPVEVSIDTDSTAVSGGGAILERSSIPVGIWILVVIIILLVIMALWVASRRGVFSG